MASVRDKRREEVQFRVMQILHRNPKSSTREIANELGISNGSAYYCLSELIEKGYVKFINFTQSKSKSQYLYKLTPKGLSSKTALTVKFLERKRQEYIALKSEIEKLEYDSQFFEISQSNKIVKTDE
jgi:EPS-associated MarR family transcriptional regulator